MTDYSIPSNLAEKAKNYPTKFKRPKTQQTHILKNIENLIYVDESPMTLDSFIYLFFFGENYPNTYA